MSRRISQPCNIAIIAGQLVVGGAERQLYLWLSHLDRERFRPVVITLHPNYNDYWENVITGLNIPVLPISQRQNRFVRLLDIVKVLRPYKPQLIHGWHQFASPYAGMAAKMLGAKSLGAVRGTFRAFRHNLLTANLTLYLEDAILANSKVTAEQLLIVRKRKKQNIYTVQNAVVGQEHIDPLQTREKLERKFDISPGGIWIGSLGRLDSGKRFDLLLQVILLLKEDQKDFHCLLIGDGPERSRLEKEADELGISQHVIFAGEVPHASDWLSALDIFCFMSLDEGLPNAVMEAATAGIPIVSWRVSFMEELLKNANAALLVEPLDLIAFKETVLKLIHSPELRIKMGREGRSQMLENFTLERFVQRMTDVYDDILGIRQLPDVRMS